MKSNASFTGFGSKFLLMCILLHFSSALSSSKLSAAPPPKDRGAEAKAASSSKSATPKAVSLPLFFEANKGQTDPRVKFLTRSAGYTLFLTPTETVLAESKSQIGKSESGWGAKLPEVRSTSGTFVRMQLVGANPSPVMTGVDELPGKVNYLIGSNRADWHTGVSLFSKVRSEQVYPGVDLLFHGDDKQLEYDFIVAPGADPSKIAFRVRDAERIEIDSQGDLILHTPDSDFRMRKPVIYQIVGSDRRVIEGNYVQKGKREIAFRIGSYDHTRALVIDPVIKYSTFLGGNGEEEAVGMAVDDTISGSPKLIIAGTTTDSTSFGGASPLPFTVIGFPTSSTPVVVEVGFVAEIDATKTGSASLVYLTFVGGKTPFQAADGGCETFFSWLTLDKSLGAGNVQPVAGGITNCKDYPFTVTLHPESGATGHDLASTVTRLTSNGMLIDEAALLGADKEVDTTFVSTNAAGNITVSGSTKSSALPVMNPYVANFNDGAGTGVIDCYLAILNRTGLSISYATYLNAGQGSTSNSNVGCGGFQDSSGNILAGGNTESGAVFNLGPGNANLATSGFQPTYCPGGGTSCPGTTTATFAMKLNPNLSGTNQLLYATYYSGGGDTRARNGSFDLGNGVVAIVGGTTSGTAATLPAIPVKNAFQTSNISSVSGGQTGFLLLLDTTQTGANSLLCSTMLGGSSGNDVIRAVSTDAFDPTSFRILLGGSTSSSDFPKLNPLQSFQGTAGSSIDAFITVLKVPQPGQAFSASLYFSSFVGSGTVPTISGQQIDNERIDNLTVDSNHTIYASGTAFSSAYFTPAGVATPNGFQTACVSCGATVPFADVVVFTLTTGGNATLSSISVTPTAPTIGEGQTQQFQALGFFSDGTIQNITNTATWASSDPTVATISNTTGSQGLATANSTKTGTTQITAAEAQFGITSPAVTLTVAAPTTISFDILNGTTSGGTVVDNQTPHLINCFTDPTGVQSGTCSAGYAPGSVITFTETPGAGAKFTGWSTQCATGTGGTTPTCTINVPSGPIGAITASFGNGPGTFALTLALPATGDTGNGVVNSSSVGGGGIDCKFVGSAAPVGINGGACSNAIASGQIIQLIPLPSDQNTNFVGWAGSCPFQPVGSNDCFVTMSQAQTLTPVFTIVQITLNITITGNGTVTSDTGGINCSNPPSPSNVCKAVYNSGTNVTLTESPGTGYSFKTPSGWSPGVCGINSTATTCILTLSTANEPTGSLTQNASFVINSYLLNVSTKGGNGTGTVTSNPNNLGGTIGCGPNNQPPSGCGLEEQFGAMVTLTETPSAPTTGTTNTFTSWSASGVSGFTLPAACTTGAPTTCTFSMPAVPTGSTFLVTATFTEQFELMVAENGTGTGKVTSQSGLFPAISCISGSTTGCSAFYSAGQAVMLTAAVTSGTGSTFTGWSGAACLGVTTPTCSLTMTQPLDVTATFTAGATPDFTLSAMPPSQTVTAGNSTTYTVNATALNGFTGNVALTVSGLPAGATGTFSPSPIAPGTPSTLTVTTTGSTPASTSTLTITGASGALMHTTTVQLIVTPVAAPTLQSITVTPTPVTSAVGTMVQFTATGMFSDGSQQNLTATATWASSIASVATVNSAPSANPGQATVVGAGETIISATESGVSSVASGTSAVLATPFTGQYQLGDLFVSDEFGLVDVFTPTGTFVGALNTQDALSAGMAFDKTGNLYVTTFDTGGVVEFDQTGKLLGRFGSGYTGNPESIVFSQSGNAIVGAAQNNTSGCPPTTPQIVPIFEFNSGGSPINTFQVQAECRGSDWVELLKDQQTVLYTSEGTSVKSFNISTNKQNPNFASGLPGPSAFALRQLPDGDILVADSTAALLLNGTTGAVKTTYTPTGAPQSIFALNLDPDGASFWTADLLTGTVYKFDIATGNQLLSFVTPDGAASGLAIFGEKPPGENNITISGAGSGAGTVTSNPTGLDCGAGGAAGTVCTAPFTDGTSVTLTATPSTGSTFGGFSANCTPANPQTNPPTCTVALGTTDVTVTTTFTSQATHFLVSAPATAKVGAAFSFTVTAKDASNNTVSNYSGTVKFTSTDGAATLPANSTLTDGSGTFPATLNTVGGQTITATDTVAASITGTSGTITVAGVGPTPMLAISKTHAGNFTQGQQGAQYTLTVSNASGAAPTTGTLAQSATVQATGSIYDTGAGSTPPTMITLPSGATSIVFNSVTGSITAGCASSEGCIILNHGTGDNANDPDGVGAAPATSSNTGTSSISGIQAAPGAGYLVGLFVPVGGPAGPAPTALNFTSSGLGTSFTSLSPQLDQVFFIGDGLTGNGTGTLQTFNIPTGAGQLWLGISDAGFYNGPPGAYGDNLGFYTVNLTVNTPSSGGVTVTETAPAGLTLASMAGTGWICGSPNPANICTRSDSLGPGQAYPAITVAVNVATDAASPQVNMASVMGGGSAPASASDATVIVSASAAATHFSVTASANATTGTAFNFTVTALTASNTTATGYTGTVHFTSTDDAAVLPANSTLTDGVGTFSATLNTSGGQTITATDTVSNTITGTSGTITVSSSPVIITVAPPRPGQPAVPTINPGGSVSYGLVLTSQPGFSGTVTLSCTATTSTGAPASQFITCAPDPASVTIKPGGTTQVAIVLNTFCSRNAPLDMPVPGGPAEILIVLLTGLGLASITWIYRRRPRWVLTFAALTIAVYSIVGCGSTPKGTAGATPAGEYNLDLTFRVNGGPPIPGPMLQLFIN